MSRGTLGPMRRARQTGRTPPPPIGKRRPLSKGVDTPPVPRLLTPRVAKGAAPEHEQDAAAAAALADPPSSCAASSKIVGEAVNDFWKTLRPAANASLYQISTEPRWRFSPLARDLEAKQKARPNRPQSSEKHPALLSSPREPKRHFS